MNEFLRAYIEAALWSSSDESDESGGEPLDANYGIDDLAPETLEKMKADCEKFQSENADLLTEENCLSACPVEAQGGHDFWLTRNGHGCGFWETTDWVKEAGEKLTESCKRFGECNLYVGDDNMIYIG